MASTVKLAEYLFTRLRQLGVESIHGVPGDFNLSLLDYVEDQGLHWTSNCNELNAGYAADGYARIKGLGALITTFGVGELSAVNAVAGAYAELVPLVHIVGTPARDVQESRARLHHTFNDGEFGRFAQMHAQVTLAQTNLTDPRSCPEQIDSIIRQCLLHSRPVYIQLPVDMVTTLVSAERLSSKIEVPEPSPSGDEAAALELVLGRMYASKRPMILVDGESRAYGILDGLDKLIKSTQWPTWTSPFGKSCINENLPNVLGVWRGFLGTKEEIEYVKSSDLILCFGPHFSNTNSYQGTAVPDPAVTILLGSSTVKAGDQGFRDLPARHFLKALLSKLDASKAVKSGASYPAKTKSQVKPWQDDPDGLITQKLFYRAFNNYIRPGDIIFAETGTPGYGSHDFELPQDTLLFKPVTWLSIGYMLPAAQGAALAQRELHATGKWYQRDQGPRTILLIGDGSFQMTAQELSTIIREQLNVLVVLINNNGYTIERCLHGWNRGYNDIATWRYLQAPALFGASQNPDDKYHSRTSTAKSWKELHAVLEETNAAAANEKSRPRLDMVEVFMDREDAPDFLADFLQKQKKRDEEAKKA